MAKPQNEAIPISELVDRALAVVRADRFPYLATVDGDQPRLRPVSPVRTDGFTVYIANLQRYNKTAEIASNPKVELGYLDSHHDQVRITAVAERSADTPTLREVADTTPLRPHSLGHSPNPCFVLYRGAPNRVLLIKEWALVYTEAPKKGPAIS